MQISLSHDLDKLKRKLSNLEQKQIPYATKLALDKTAQDVQKASIHQLKNDIDRPTPFTLRGFYVKRASKRKLVAYVGIKDIQADYLKFAIEGGTQKPKRKAVVVPAKLRLNKYGNITKGRVQKLLAKPNTFSGVVNGKAGIWERNKRGQLKMLIQYKKEQRHTPRFKFVPAAEKVAKAKFAGHLKESLRYAVKTAK